MEGAHFPVLKRARLSPMTQWIFKFHFNQPAPPPGCGLCVCVVASSTEGVFWSCTPGAGEGVWTRGAGRERQMMNVM